MSFFFFVVAEPFVVMMIFARVQIYTKKCHLKIKNKKKIQRKTKALFAFQPWLAMKFAISRPIHSFFFVVARRLCVVSMNDDIVVALKLPWITTATNQPASQSAQQQRTEEATLRLFIFLFHLDKFQSKRFNWQLLESKNRGIGCAAVFVFLTLKTCNPFGVVQPLLVAVAMAVASATTVTMAMVFWCCVFLSHAPAQNSF